MVALGRSMMYATLLPATGFVVSAEATAIMERASTSANTIARTFFMSFPPLSQLGRTPSLAVYSIVLFREAVKF